MSEYQYYEFQAIDRPLTEREMRELRAYSTRATITSTRFVNHYEWGGFKGNPSRWMERYFDAFLFLANWGTHELMLRVPKTSFDLRTARQYCRSESAAVRASGEFVILEFCSDDEEGEWTDDGSGWLSSLIPLRRDLESGDHRALYLAWLLGVQRGAPDHHATEPPVPPGLRQVTAPLTAFAEFLRIDGDLIAVAAEHSPDLSGAVSSKDFARWVQTLPDSDKTEFLVRLAAGDQAPVQAELLRRFQKGRQALRAGGAPKPRTVAQLLAAAKQRADARRRVEAARAAREQRRREREETQRRRRYLDDLAKREDETWHKVDILIAMRRPQDYDEAVRLLKDLQELAQRDGRGSDTRVRIQALYERHATKPSFLGRLQKSGLVKG
ncbi:MAG: hypothetical protein AB1451_11420 [Nitrospirota bacterium]